MDIISHGYKGPSPHSAVPPEIAAVQEALGAFELGRFLLDNLGLNGHWTSYVLMYRNRGGQPGLSSDGTPITELESWLLTRCPIFLATQQRFQIFRTLTQALIRPGMKLASLPAGLMDDLLTLDYSNCPGVMLTAVDLDEETLCEARENYQRIAPPVQAEFEQRDAWQLASTEQWDLLTSNGLNIYVEDDERCTDLYRSVARALKPGGIYIVSFITPPAEWRPRDQKDLEYQRFLFSEVVPVKWSCVRAEATTREQLGSAGFEVVSITYDAQRMFPSVVAQKRR